MSEEMSKELSDAWAEIERENAELDAMEKRNEEKLKEIERKKKMCEEVVESRIKEEERLNAEIKKEEELGEKYRLEKENLCKLIEEIDTDNATSLKVLKEVFCVSKHKTADGSSVLKCLEGKLVAGFPIKDDNKEGAGNDQDQNENIPGEETCDIFSCPALLQSLKK